MQEWHDFISIIRTTCFFYLNFNKSIFIFLLSVFAEQPRNIKFYIPSSNRLPSFPRLKIVAKVSSISTSTAAHTLEAMCCMRVAMNIWAFEPANNNIMKTIYLIYS